jgi:hypothetical protein
MEMIWMIVGLSLAAVPLAVASGWLVGSGSRPLATLMLGRDAWRRSQTAWPVGVQEDDDVSWHFGGTGKAPVASDASGPPSIEPETERVRPTLRVRSR